MKRVLLALLAASILPGCAGIGASRMVLPSSASLGEQIPVTSIGFGRSGDFHVAEYDGDFRRSADRLTFDDFYEEAFGRTDFAMRAPDPADDFEGMCDMREANIQMGIFGSTVQPMAFRCGFSHHGTPIDGWFELQEVKPRIATLKRDRRGRIVLGDIVLDIRSIHRIEGAVIETATPVGYVFERDGVIVGAIDINGRPIVHMPVSADPEVRRAVLTAAVPLALFWGPEVAPGALGDS